MFISASFNYFMILILGTSFCLTGMQKQRLLERALFVAVKKGLPEDVETYLKLGISPEITNSAGMSLIEIAINAGQPRSLKLLLAYGADPNRKRPSHGDYLSQIVNTPRELRKKYVVGPECMSLLLEYGANPDGADNMGTPLNDIIMLKRHDSVALKEYNLLTRAGANLNLRDSRGKTPLYNALMGDKQEVGQLLLLHGASLNSASSDVNVEEKFKPKSLACLLGDVEKLKALWKRSIINHFFIVGDTLRRVDKLKLRFSISLPFGGFEITVGNCEEKTTLLQLAAAQGHLNVVQFLLKRQVDPDIWNTSGDTPADLAVRNGHTKCTQLILDAGGKFNRQRWLHAAICRKDADAIKQLLKDKPGLINERDDIGNTPLHIAGRQPHTPMLNYLLCGSVNLYIRNRKKISPVQAIFTNCCPGDLLQVSTLLLEPALKVLAKSETAGVALVGSIPEMRLYLANHLACNHLHEHNNSKIAKERSLSVIRTLKALRATAHSHRHYKKD
jgi:ankyrin repeat protein